MATDTMFFFRRREEVTGKDGVKLIVECEDVLNLYHVVRGWWSTLDTFTLQMTDAHEESREKQYFDNPQQNKEHIDELKKRKQDIPKERKWVLSYVDLHGVDVMRYRAATELIVPSEVDRLPTVKYPTVLNFPKPVVDVEVSQTEESKANPLSVVKGEPEEELPAALPEEPKEETVTIE